MARTLQPWSPYHPVEDFSREFDDPCSRFVDRGTALMPVLPRVESFLDGREFVIRLDLPGVDSKDLEVTVKDEVVTVRVLRQRHDKHEDLDFIHCEVPHGGFERSVTIPRAIRAEDVKATHNHGVLELRMPAPKETAGRRVSIHVETPKAKNFDRKARRRLSG